MSTADDLLEIDMVLQRTRDDLVVRKYKKKVLTLEQQLRRQMILAGQPVPPLKRGRPFGSKNKSPGSLKPRAHVTLNHLTAHQHFDLHAGVLWRVNKGNIVGQMAHTRKPRPSRANRAWAPWLVRFQGEWYGLALVAWWVLHKTPLADGLEVICTSMRDPPYLSVETLECRTLA